ncbi:MAG: RusA family crossover junction endodeoxyribonuclease [Cyclobacteriaceae bacterium]|nr:RusA family crossover junction endodeoxyribonuclease [Cyclobacteriaceae bacterium]
MKITSIFENCDYERPFLINESGDSKIELRIELSQLTSVQSRKQRREEMLADIRAELLKYKWIISGLVSVELHWFLSHYQRHETDKSADIDNITKPMLDSLVGENGIIIDDSQIKSIYTQWHAKNQALEGEFLRIWISFSNDFSLLRGQLFFVQYHKAMCTAFDLKRDEIKNLLAIKFIIRNKLRSRKNVKGLSQFSFFPLTYSSFDFHRTRLSGFSGSKIFTIEEINQLCLDLGLTYFRLKKELIKWRLPN